MKKVKGWKKYFGLMFRSRNTEPLKFVFDKEVMISLHSFFVFFSFNAYWFSEQNELIEKRLVRPFSWDIKPHKKFKYLVEVPINKYSLS